MQQLPFALQGPAASRLELAELVFGESPSKRQRSWTWAAPTGLLSYLARAEMPPCSRLEALGRLFAQNVRIYAHPMTAGDLREWLNSFSKTDWEWNETNGWVSVAQLRRAPPLGHLYAYVLANNFLVPMPVPAARSDDA